MERTLLNTHEPRHHHPNQKCYQTLFTSINRHSPSSFPFSLPRSFLSFFGFFKGPSSPVAASGTRLWDPDWPGTAAGPGGIATGNRGGWELALGVGRISPSVKDWYCNKDFKRNLDIETKCEWELNIWFQGEKHKNNNKIDIKEKRK